MQPAPPQHGLVCASAFDAIVAVYMGKIFLEAWGIFCQTRAMDLLQRTYELIEKSELSQRQIAAGAGVKRDWLAKLIQGRIRSPGTPKVQSVYNFLRSPQAQRARRAA